VTTRRIEAPIGPALVAAAAELAAAPAGTEETWVLPDEEHALTAAIEIDVGARSLTLRGGDHCILVFAAGGLTVKGGVVELDELAVEAAESTAALRVEAPRIRIHDVDAAVSGAGDAIALDLDAGDEGVIDAEDVRVSRATAGGDAVGLRARGGTVRVTGAEIDEIDGASAVGVEVGAIDDAECVGIQVNDVTAGGPAIGALIGGGDRVQVAEVEVADISGDESCGVAVLGSGTGAGTVGAVDLDAERVSSTTRATGAIVAAPRRVSLRGFTAANITAPRASGVVVVGGTSGGADGPADVEVGFGRIGRVVASAGDAAGLRVIAASSPRPVIVRDVSIAEVVGSPVPVSAEPPRDADGDSAWQSWGAALLADLADDATPPTAPPSLLASNDVVGVSIAAVVDEIQPFLDDLVAGDIAVIDSSIRTVSGTAVQIEGALRPAWVRRTEVSTALRAAWLGSDQLILANTTWDRLGAPLEIAPGEIRAFDSIFSRISGAGAPVHLDPDADWGEGHALFADAGDERFETLGALPYRLPGDAALPPAQLAGTLPPPSAIDLRLVESSELHAASVAPPPDDLDLTDDDRLFVGAHPPEAAAGCRLYDPLRTTDTPAPRPPPPSPIVDYRARDAKTLLALMLARSDQVMRSWTDRGPADLTTMLLEAVADRLDHIAYAQERATAEGFLEDARLRRSVEDHVRPLDYLADPGLSAVTLLRFRFDFAHVAGVIAERTVEAAATSDSTRAAWLTGTLAALEEIADDGAIEIPAGTLAANARNDDQVIVFATEEPLPYFPDLDEVGLVDDLPEGTTTAILAGKLPGIAVGRWLVLWRGPGLGGHVVRITTLTPGTDVVAIGWDPRRPLPWPLAANEGVVLGNVVPAHHGVPLSTLPTSGTAGGDAESLARYRALLDLEVVGGPSTEVVLPYSPVSVHATGYPLPGDEGRRGKPRIRVLIDDDEWHRVDDLAGADPGDEVFALRSSADGRAAIRFGDGRSSGAALPSRVSRVRLDLTVGLGRAGNVGPDVINRLLHVPVDASRGPITGFLFREDMETIRGLMTVGNPLPAIGGRDAEPIDVMRYRAPLLAARPLSAVTPDDYERVALALPDVAGAYARTVTAAVRPVVRVTVLLRDEDTLDDDEHLRRWAAVRSALESARLLGFDVETVPPRWTPLDLDVVVDANPHYEAGALRDMVIGAVAGDGGLLDPDVGGLGGDVQLADLYRTILAVPGVAAARVRRFRRLEPRAKECLPEGVIPMGPDEVAVVRGPRRPDADGVFTVTVCGGMR
jgi:hypothetical protein